MNSIIRDKLNTISTKPGVYLMKDKTGKIIYVGKAKNLKNRVSSYFNSSSKTTKVLAMVENVCDFDYIVVDTEYDALALENNLIKKHMPYYNILLKDGKQYPYIKVDIKSAYPKFTIARKVDKDNAKYFGPFIGKFRAIDLIYLVNNAFKLRDCKKNLDNGKTYRKCIRCDMNICVAPCSGNVKVSEYKKLINKAIDFLNGDDTEILMQLNTNMQQCIASQNYEMAITYRDNIKLVKEFNDRLVTQLTKRDEMDIFVNTSNGERSSIANGVVRNGKLLGVETRSVEAVEDNYLESYIMQYYTKNYIPKLILTEVELSENCKKFILSQSENATKFLVPKMGVKKYLVSLVHQNAYQHFIKTSNKESLNIAHTVGAIKQLQKSLNLKKIPRRIECYDISHISGTNKVASMVVFIDGAPMKSHYRKFKIKTVEGNNDFASLQETLKRRLTELNTNEKDISFRSVPDLLVIDGGKGQLSSVMEIFNQYAKKYKDDIEVVSLAKRIEEVFKPNNPIPIVLSHDFQDLKLLQRVRDEAHRFAITFHRDLRSKTMLISVFDGIQGVGDVKKKLLNRTFKTFEDITNASVEDFEKLDGINRNLAEKIYNKIHSN